MDKSSNIHPKTDEIFVSVETPPPEQNQPNSQETIRFIDVHIYDNVPSEEIEPDQATIIDEDSQDDTTPVQPRSYIRNIIMLLAGVMLIAAIVIALLLPMLVIPPATTTITVIPVSKRFDITQSIILPSRVLPTLSMSQQKTIATTGWKHQDAQSAHGIVTFYNSLTVAQTIPGGTLLATNNGLQVVTDQDVTISAVQYPTLGYASVQAHTLATGPSSDIPPASIYGACCRQGVSAVNQAFSGGQVARNYRVVSQQDITAVTNDLKSSLQASTLAAFQAQVQPNESLIPPACKLSSTPNHKPGVEATQVQVTVSESCTAFAYSTEALQNQLQQLTSQEASKQFGSGYALSGTISSNVIQATPKGDGSITLKVRLSAAYSYHFPSQEQQHMINSIAGKSRSEAISTLLHMPGVQSISISSTTLPKDTQDIRLLVIYEQ